MGVRQDFERRITKKEQEIADLERQLSDARSYLQALHDAMKLIPKELLEQGGVGQSLRPGSALAKARDVIRKSGKPLHVLEILKAIGKPQDKKNKVSLGGSLSRYARAGDIFTRSAPNTFGLREFGSSPESEDSDLPESFGDM